MAAVEFVTPANSSGRNSCKPLGPQLLHQLNLGPTYFTSTCPLYSNMPREVTEGKPCSPPASDMSGLPCEFSSGHHASAESQAPPLSFAPSQDETQLTAIQAFLQDSLHQLRSMPNESINEEYLSCIQIHLHDNMQLIRTMPPQIVHVLLGTCQQVDQLINHLRHLVQLSQLSQRTHPCHVDFLSSASSGPSPSFKNLEAHQTDRLTEQGHQYLVVRAILGHLIATLKYVQNASTHSHEPLQSLLQQAHDSLHANYNVLEAIFPSDQHDHALRSIAENPLFPEFASGQYRRLRPLINGLALWHLNHTTFTVASLTTFPHEA